MPQIPDVPNLQTVDKPMMSPGQAARPGETVSRLGQETEQISAVGSGLVNKIIEAQKHVDRLAADNQLNAAYLSMQDDLLKTTNSRDIEGVLKQGNDNVAKIMKDWGGSPAARDIEITAQGYLPHMEHHATIRQIDLMGKETHVQIGELKKGLLNEVVDPATSASALAKYSAAVDGSVESKLMEGWQAQLYKDEFRKDEQITLLDRFSTSPNPADNKAGLDEVIQHPEHYPDLSPQERDAYKRKLEEAFRVNTNWMEKVGVEQFIDNELPNFRKMYSHPDGSLDLPEAMKEVKRREGLPLSDPEKINVRQGDAMRKHLDEENADQTRLAKERSDKAEKEISDAMAQHKYVEARQLLNKNMPLLEGRTSEQLDKAITARVNRTDDEISHGEDVSAYMAIKNMDPDDPKAIERAIIGSPNLKDSTRRQLINWLDTKEEKILSGGLAAADKFLHSQIAPTKDFLSIAGPRHQAKSAEAQQALFEWVKDQKDKERKGGKPITEAEIFKHAQDILPRYHVSAADDLEDMQEQAQEISDVKKDAKKEAKKAGIVPGKKSESGPKEGTVKTNSSGVKVKFTGGKWVLAQ